MKLITAYIRPFMQEKVVDALRTRRIHGATVIRCEGFGRQIDGTAPHYEDASVTLGYAPKTRIEIVCRDEEVQPIVRVIRETAHTGRHGDGKVFVSEVTTAVDILTGQEGESVL